MNFTLTIGKSKLSMGPSVTYPLYFVLLYFAIKHGPESSPAYLLTVFHVVTFGLYALILGTSLLALTFAFLIRRRNRRLGDSSGRVGLLTYEITNKEPEPVKPKATEPRNWPYIIFSFTVGIAIASYLLSLGWSYCGGALLGAQILQAIILALTIHQQRSNAE